MTCELATQHAYRRPVNSQLNARIDDLDSQLNARIDDLDSQLNARIDGVNSQLNTRIDDLNTRFEARFDDVQEDIRELRALIVDFVQGVESAG